MSFDYYPLVMLKNGKMGAIPIFCIAGAGASVSCFVELACKIPEHIPLIGLQAQGLDGMREPYSSVEAAARTYFDVVRKAWPHGPYRILGHSFGGWVAFELAGLLTTADHNVEALFLLDSDAPHDRGIATPSITRVDALEQLVQVYNLMLASQLRLTRKDFAKLDQRAQITLLERELVQAGMLPKNAPSGIIDGVVRVFEANVCTTYYASKVFDGTLWLVNAKESHVNVEAQISKWRQYASMVCCYTTPGNHVTMLLAENVAHLGEWVGNKLESHPVRT